MMDGPQHYRAGDEAMISANHAATRELAVLSIATAQAHYTAALAAATVRLPGDHRDWADAIVGGDPRGD